MKLIENPISTPATSSESLDIFSVFSVFRGHTLSIQ